MSVIYLIIIILGCSFQNVTKKAFAQKTGGKGAILFALITSSAAALFFAVTSRGFTWNAEVIPYSIFFALFYSLAVIFSTYAVSCGSLSFTALIVSYSLLIPTLYGLIFLHEPIGGGFIPGLLLLMLSLFLINGKDRGNSPITFRWVIYVFLAFIGNGVCSVAQKMQQTAFSGAYKNEFMIIALLIVVLILIPLSLKASRGNTKKIAKAGWYLAVICGTLNGLVNLLVMVLSNIIPVSLMFPLMSAGGIILTFFLSRYMYKEQFTKRQLVGFVTGILSIICLNI